MKSASLLTSAMNPRRFMLGDQLRFFLGQFRPSLVPDQGPFRPSLHWFHCRFRGAASSRLGR